METCAIQVDFIIIIIIIIIILFSLFLLTAIWKIWHLGGRNRNWGWPRGDNWYHHFHLVIVIMISANRTVHIK
jgi:uncharacterized metal-binding protein